MHNKQIYKSCTHCDVLKPNSQLLILLSCFLFGYLAQMLLLPEESIILNNYFYNICGPEQMINKPQTTMVIMFNSTNCFCYFLSTLLSSLFFFLEFPFISLRELNLLFVYIMLKYLSLGQAYLIFHPHHCRLNFFHKSKIVEGKGFYAYHRVIHIHKLYVANEQQNSPTSFKKIITKYVNCPLSIVLRLVSNSWCYVFYFNPFKLNYEL